jgi:hypothetical protein
MTRGADVINFLCPDVEFALNGDDFDSVLWVNLDKAPITKKQYQDGFAQYDAWKSEQDAAKAAQRQALLTRLGITEEEARILLGGN